MWDEITRLASEEGLTILLTTHYLEEADRLAKQLVIVDRGRVVAEGTPDELKGVLKGDAITVELEEPDLDGRVERALEPMFDVREIQLDGKTLRARSDDGARAVPAVLQALEAGGAPVASVTVSRPSLDDVYLRLTGRSFAEADTEAESGRGDREEVRR
jgi:ABC-2 type transport system ATP-binding protein